MNCDNCDNQIDLDGNRKEIETEEKVYRFCTLSCFADGFRDLDGDSQ